MKKEKKIKGPRPALRGLEGCMGSKEASNYIGKSEQTLRHWRNKGCGPAYIKFRGGKDSVYYTKEDVDMWLAKNLRKITSTAEGRSA